MRFSLILILAILMFSNCKNECIDDNIKLGDVSFAENTLEFINFYEDKQSIQYISPNGTIREHLIMEEDSLDPILCVKTLCRPTYEIGAANGCEYYDTEAKSYTMTAGDLFLHLKAGVQVFTPETQFFYDFVEIGMNVDTANYSAGLVSSSNFEMTFGDTLNTVLSNKLYFSETDTLGGFENVWAFKNIEDDIYLILDKEKGIVQYKYDDTIWTLVE